ncbi:MFS-type transporter clz9-like [Cotesia glomerata]|uniref:MFS-type transporter clz9-like n=1 Tax=Cotesia glomerata TaxID=32391 RepID=UPI001D004F9D|nr:MFS-type transporter clz9-like [Cotesia glomerata]
MPGRQWYNAFRRRHPQISERIAQNLTYSQVGVSKEKIRAWFQEVKDNLPLNLQIIDSSRIFNLDESAFKLNPKGNSVLATKGNKTVYNIVGNDKKECLTTLICGNAAGQILPPMVLFPYKRIPRNIATSMPKGWGIGCSDSGWMTAETFYEYISNVFYPWLLKNEITFPVILYLDGHASHLSYPLTKFCREMKIQLVAFYPNATHILQPMDVAMFRPLKAAWSHEVQEWKMEHNGESLKRENFASILDKSLKTLNISEIFKNGFKSTGLHPFCPDAINYKKYFDSSVFSEQAQPR